MDQSSEPTPLTPDPAANPPHQKRPAWPWVVLFLFVLAVGAYVYWPKLHGSAANSNGPKKGEKRGAGENTPVEGAKVTRGNIGVYFNGLGAVTPIYTVTVRSRVDGQLMTVNYREGEMVHQGDLLVTIDPRPFQAALTQAQGTLARDQALLENARIDLARYQTLAPQKAIPEQQLATQKATVAQYEGVVKNDQGLVDAAQVNLDYTRIPAPITGLVGLRLVDPGNIVQASDTNGMLVITQVDPISVIFTLAEDQLPQVISKMRAGQMLEVDAYDRDLKTKLAQGTLTTIDNQIDQTTGTVRMRATFDNKNSALFPNQFVNARVLVQEKRGVLLLPSAVIQRNSNATFVYLVQPDSTVAIQNVQTGVTEGDTTEISSGLKPGDVVVLTGADRLQPGAKVTVQFPGAGK
jgi:multidrug efflux system membrane fusion protein